MGVYNIHKLYEMSNDRWLFFSSIDFVFVNFESVLDSNIDYLWIIQSLYIGNKFESDATKVNMIS